MNSKIEQLQKAIYRIQRIYEKRLKKEIIKWRNLAIVDASVLYALSEKVPDDDFIINQQNKLLKVLIKHIEPVYKTFSDFTKKRLEKRIKKQDELTVFEEQFQRYLDTSLLSKSRLITDTLVDDIKQAIKVTFEAGATNQQIAKAILGVKDISPFRAETIARTEVHNASSEASFEQSLELERESEEDFYKVWIPALDERTRPDHGAMANHPPIPLGALFQVGDSKMLRPGDPNGSAKQVINCRCFLIDGTKEMLAELGYSL